MVASKKSLRIDLRQHNLRPPKGRTWRQSLANRKMRTGLRKPSILQSRKIRDPGKTDRISRLHYQLRTKASNATRKAINWPSNTPLLATPELARQPPAFGQFIPQRHINHRKNHKPFHWTLGFQAQRRCLLFRHAHRALSQAPPARKECTLSPRAISHACKRVYELAFDCKSLFWRTRERGQRYGGRALHA